MEETAGGEAAVEETAVVAFEAAEDTDEESELERSLRNDDGVKESASEEELSWLPPGYIQ